ncbi:MAG: AAA family ATPase, partial [Candidatus Marinimicrobia bacterium]|nr:AAA family ATPase [Candidatus Neomarinimicrobiota bacterium]
MTELRHREMVDRLKINFHDGDHLFVYGPPRCGKTMLLNGLAEELSPHVLLLDMDKSADRLLFDNDLDDLFVRMAENNYSEEQQYFLLIDNSQYFAGLIPLCEKLTSNIQCIFCSDNREDAFDGENVLLNNVRIFRLGTLNFREYLHFYDKDELVVYLPDEALALQELPKQSVMDELEEMYKKFLIYGGFPETVGLKEDKIVSSYFPEMVLPRLQKNLPESYGIRKKKAFYTFIIYLAQIQGHVFNESGAARDLGHRFETL